MKNTEHMLRRKDFPSPEMGVPLPGACVPWLPAASFLYGTDLIFYLLLGVEQGWGALLLV